MTLGIHYHIPFTLSNGELLVPGYFGVFIDSMAIEVSHLYLFFHTDQSSVENDYQIKSKNVTFVNMGERPTFYERMLYPSKFLAKAKGSLTKCDAILLRAPSPLAPFFYLRNLSYHNFCYLLVGDYVESSKTLMQPFFRKTAIQLFMKYYQLLQNRAVSNCLTFVNSKQLYEATKARAKKLELVKTTTLSIDSFYLREDTCQNESFQIYYVGRLDMAKGLMELMMAVKQLIQNNIPVELNFVGSELYGDQTVRTLLIAKAKELNIDNKVTFHGQKQIGDELNNMYRHADIYVIPSYQEGFPRTIWEAMANSCPVVATRVGSIPHYLEDKVSAILINPRSIPDITDAITVLLNDSTLRKTLIRNGYQLAKENTLEIQAKRITKIIKREFGV